MKYLFLLFLLFNISCNQQNTFVTNKAEKWELLENVFLFQDKESIEKYNNITKTISHQKLLGNKVAKEEEDAWKFTELDFFLDYKKILEADETIENYKVLESTNVDNKIIENLSNQMTIQYDNDEIKVFFPKENSNFQWLGTFHITNKQPSLFDVREVGGFQEPENVKISFSKDNYEIIYYNSALSERAFEKIFFISISYYNDFIIRNRLEINEISKDIKKIRKENK